MNKTLYVLAVFALLLGGCDKRYRVTKIVTGTKTLTYQINTTSSFNQTAYFQATSLVNGLLNKNYDNVQIDQFTLNAVDAQLITNPTNKATSVQVESVYLTGFHSGVLMPERSFPLGSETNAAVSAFLLFGGVRDINEDISKQLKGLNTDDVRLSALGSAVPRGQLASLTLIVKIGYTIRFSHCIDSMGLDLGCPEC